MRTIDRIGIRWIQVERTTVISAPPFDTVAERLAAAVGHPDMSLVWRDLSGARAPADLEGIGNAVIANAG